MVSSQSTTNAVLQILDRLFQWQQASGSQSLHSLVTAASKAISKLSVTRPSVASNYARLTDALIAMHLPTANDGFTSSQSFDSLLVSHMAFLDSMASGSSKARRIGFNARRRFICTIAKAGIKGPLAVFKSRLALKSLPDSKEASRNAILFGLACEASLRIPGAVEALMSLENAGLRDQWLNFFSKAVLQSKSPVPALHLSVMTPIYSLFFTQDMFLVHVLAYIDRLLLRSPEVVLKVLVAVVPYLKFDTSAIFRDKFAEPLLNQFKSSNEALRLDAASLYKSLASQSTDDDVLASIVRVVANAFSGSKVTPDIRAIYFSLLQGFPSNLPTVSSTILFLLPPLISKESSEPALNAALNVFGYHLAGLIRQNTYSDSLNDSTVDESVSFIIKGIKDKQLVTRKSHLSALHHLSVHSLSSRLGKYKMDLVKVLLEVVGGVFKSGIALLDPKKETPAFSEACAALEYILSTFCGIKPDVSSVEDIGSLLDSSSAIQSLLGGTAASSILFNEKFYGKLLTTNEDVLRFLDVYFMSIQSDSVYFSIVQDDRNNQDCKALARCFAWLSTHSSHTVRQRTIEYLTDAVSTNEFSNMGRYVTLVRLAMHSVLINGASQSETNATLAYNDVPARSSNQPAQLAFNVMTCLFPVNVDASAHPQITQALLDMVVMCVHPTMTYLHGKDLWVRFCYRVGLDPRDLLHDHGTTVVPRWLDTLTAFDETNYDETLGGFSPLFHASIRAATLSTIQLFTEISADDILPLVMPFALESLQSEEYNQVSATDVLIWQTPDNELFDDPTVAKKRDEVETSRPANADEKWERDLKMEIEAKRKAAPKQTLPTPKLSKSDYEKRQLRVQEEAAIRKRVSELKHRVLCELDIVSSVLDGVKGCIGAEACVSFSNWTNACVDTVVSSVMARELAVVSQKGEDITGVGVLAGEKTVKVFRAISQIMLGDAHEVDPDLVAYCTLRVLGIDEREYLSGIPSKYTSISLPTQLKTLVDEIAETFTVSNQLSPYAFSFLFPMIYSVVLKHGRTRSMKEKMHTEVVMRCADVLLAHCGLTGSPRLVPRQGMAECLVSLLERFPRLHMSARDGLFALSMAASDEDEESDSLIAQSRNTIHGVTLVLLDGLLSNEKWVRQSCLEALVHLPLPASVKDVFDVRVWMCNADEDYSVAGAAEHLWADVHQSDKDSCLPQTLLLELVSLVVHQSAAVRYNAGVALCKALVHYPKSVATVLQTLFELYSQKAVELVPEYDKFGMVIPASLNKKDEFEARSGIALALKALVPVIQTRKDSESLFEFLIAQESLGDRKELVQQQMLEAGLSAIHHATVEVIRGLIMQFDGYLSRPAEASQVHDRIRQAVVILLGTSAQHLGADDKRIPDVIDKLIETLKTPSEVVQIAVSDCLPLLIRSKKTLASKLIPKLLDQLFFAEKYGERRGSAYGLSGLVKGCGVASLKQYNIMLRLRDAVEDKRKTTRREGALFAYETLSFTLGRLFEPFVIQILPLLLVCFGDSNKDVRDATEDTCKVIMSKLSGYCVKLVLPTLLKGLEDKAWRTKTGSIEMMASMSALAPKQLSLSLPTIIPSICEALADSHQKVQEFAKQALIQFGDVIKNPEIRDMVPSLISALVDPNSKTLVALNILLDTTFVHYIDAPSLALLIPIIHRGMRERSADVKRKAAQIVGNMAILTEQTDLVPYLDTLLPNLKEILVDPVPEARATAAKAFGCMVEKLGEDKFPGLIEELKYTLKSDTSGVDRSGSAQGLCEIYAGLGVDRLDIVLPEFLEEADSPISYVREGSMNMLIYLPATFGEGFTQSIGKIIPTVLKGLTDEGDSVRQAALLAGQVIVRGFAKSAIKLLLPELEKGILDANWRIRQNSMQLLGDLLFHIAGIKAKMEMDATTQEEEGLGNEAIREALRAALGESKFDDLLASIYIVRGDAVASVRQVATHVWKAIVTNTPKTLKDILPNLMNTLIVCLSSSNMEKRGVAARVLGDLVKKMGESILQRVVPILETGLKSSSADMRQGVCYGMAEIIAAITKGEQEEFILGCVPLVKTALVDSSGDVRSAAAQTFDYLQQHLGNRAVEDILPQLLKDLKTDGIGFALEALQQIMKVRSNVVFPILLPTLLTKPIKKSNAEALGNLISVAGSALNKKVESLLKALLEGLNQKNDAVDAIREALRILMSSVSGEDGVHQTLMLLLGDVRDGSKSDKKAGCQAICFFFEESEESFEPYIPDWLQLLVGMLSGADGQDLLPLAWKALDALVKRIPKDEMADYVVTVRRGIRDAELGVVNGNEVPGFNLPRGIAPILTILAHSLVHGPTETKEQAALGIGDILGKMSEAPLKPFVTQIAGPLIRVIGDRFPAIVKAAILQTISILLKKVPLLLKPFLPQLQRTFVKSLTEQGSSKIMRERAAECLGLLIPLQLRLDPLVTELIQPLRTTEDVELKPGLWDALSRLLHNIEKGREISDTSKTNIAAVLTETIESSSLIDSVEVTGVSKAFGAYCRYVSEDEARQFIRSRLIGAVSPGVSVNENVFVLKALLQVLIDAPAVIEGDEGLEEKTLEIVCESLKNSKSAISEVAATVAAQLVSNHDKVQSVYKSVVDSLVEVIKSGVSSVETRLEAIKALKDVAKSANYAIQPYINPVILALMKCVRDRTISIKLASENALVHVLQIREGKDKAKKYIDSLDDATVARAMQEYMKVLLKAADRESDDEDEVFD